ncbi:TetR/AcrR family transcriptional regulator [Aeromicrobium chenweiae]|uniref:TetR family transcriptional regulator n=2 Tax=Bacteria TaxID=2 RepID=A0A2S0WHJ3_9ACTN|nr:TetR/AcrR family transcriptional regulator [Aeromicrobium chenweiae]AWB90791.1 TetR family transcriptional regulator [Aeromicrobium chenweiae]TGN31054.1 TetR/AcrR family transcriptional regulator [Aeromicrobium chenweiae]
MTTRREQILDTAATLFAERGFHGVSVHDIGGACGISGPALYKHFAGKDDILAQALTSISEQLLAEGRARARAATDPSAALDALIAWHIEFALGHPALIVIQEREWGNLGAEGRREVRALQLAYIDIWVDVLRRLRDDLDAAEARAAVQATFGLLNSTPHSARISPEVMRTRLAAMARASLLA